MRNEHVHSRGRIAGLPQEQAERDDGEDQGDEEHAAEIAGLHANAQSFGAGGPGEPQNLPALHIHNHGNADRSDQRQGGREGGSGPHEGLAVHQVDDAEAHGELAPEWLVGVVLLTGNGARRRRCRGGGG